MRASRRPARSDDELNKMPVERLDTRFIGSLRKYLGFQASSYMFFPQRPSRSSGRGCLGIINQRPHRPAASSSAARHDAVSAERGRGHDTVPTQEAADFVVSKWT